MTIVAIPLDEVPEHLLKKALSRKRTTKAKPGTKPICGACGFWMVVGANCVGCSKPVGECTCHP